jgi:hypothetical protein
MNTGKMAVLYVILAFVFCSGIYLHVSKPQEKAEIQRWTLVTDKTTHKGQALTDLDLMWVISPKGEWFVVPEAQKTRFKASKSGEHIQLPESAHLWDRVLMAPDKADSAKLRMGLPVSRTNSINTDIESVLIPSYFYSRS